MDVMVEKTRPARAEEKVTAKVQHLSISRRERMTGRDEPEEVWYELCLHDRNGCFHQGEVSAELVECIIKDSVNYVATATPEKGITLKAEEAEVKK